MPSPLDDRLQRLADKEPLAVKKARTPKARRNPANFEIDPTRLPECSHSELVALAQHLGKTGVTRATAREEIIEIITEDLNGPDLSDGDSRDAIHRFVDVNRATISAAIMRCDLQCLSCPHFQVVECYLTNQDLLAE